MSQKIKMHYYPFLREAAKGKQSSSEKKKNDKYLFSSAEKKKRFLPTLEQSQNTQYTKSDKTFHEKTMKFQKPDIIF
jgi:hypothetical protein